MSRNVDVPLTALRDSQSLRLDSEANNIFQSALSIWQQASDIARYQGEILVNGCQWWPKIALAPATNFQEILSRWVVGSQVNIYGSTDPQLEDYIRNNVAGYGSQLGTILDYLEVLQQKIKLTPTPAIPEDPVRKLNSLIQDIKDAKTRESSAKKIAALRR